MNLVDSVQLLQLDAKKDENAKDKDKTIHLKDKAKENKENTLFVGLVSAIVIFKRLAKMIRSRRRIVNQRKGIKSALFKKVMQSNLQVRSAEFGRPVITLAADTIDEYREYMDRRKEEFKVTNAVTYERRHATRPSTYTIPTAIAKSEYEHRNRGVPVVNRLRSLHSGHFNPNGTNDAKMVKDLDDPDLVPQSSAKALTHFFESVVEKNSHMHRFAEDNEKQVRSGKLTTLLSLYTLYYFCYAIDY
jgi:hypothetical protein